MDAGFLGLEALKKEGLLPAGGLAGGSFARRAGPAKRARVARAEPGVATRRGREGEWEPTPLWNSRPARLARFPAIPTLRPVRAKRAGDEAVLPKSQPDFVGADHAQRSVDVLTHELPANPSVAD